MYETLKVTLTSYKFGVVVICYISLRDSPRFIPTLCLFSITFCMKVEFRMNGSIKLYVFCWGLLSIYQSPHFVLVFTQRWVRLREWISAV